MIYLIGIKNNYFFVKSFLKPIEFDGFSFFYKNLFYIFVSLKFYYNNMVAHQYKIRVEKSLVERIEFDINDIDLKNSSIELIDKQTAKNIIIQYEWLKTIPHQTSFHFGIYFNINNKKYLGGVLIYSQDYAQNTGVWDKYGFNDKMLLLSRGVCLWWTPKNSASYFISKSIKWLKENTKYRIVTATVDPMAGEIGTIYQSLNWIYVGLMSGNYSNNSESKRFSVLINGKLRYSRSIRKEFGTMKKNEILKKYPDAIFIPQYRKRRYFYFFDSKNKNKEYKNNIKFLIQPYPKRNVNCEGIIYKITNLINNKIYIGQTIRSLIDRINDYKNGLGNDYLNNAFKKYGFDNFKFEIIETASSIDGLNEKEIELISKYKTTDKNIGYNIAYGGKNSIPSQETLDKMSKAHKGIKQTDMWINKRIHSKGTKEAKKYGKEKTEEEKKYLSINSPKYWLGKKRDDETIKKISETKRKNGASDKMIEKFAKTVYRININTNEYETYISTVEASKYNDVSSSSISRYCSKNKTKGIYKWTYIKPC